MLLRRVTPLDLSYVLKTMAVSMGVLGVDEPGTLDFLGLDFFCTFLDAHTDTHKEREKAVEGIDKSWLRPNKISNSYTY